MKEEVNHPAHYNQGGIEAIDVIEAWGLGFCLGNTVKYIARAEHKGSLVKDLQKAKWYLEREIAKREAKELGPFCLCSNCGEPRREGERIPPNKAKKERWSRCPRCRAQKFTYKT